MSANFLPRVPVPVLFLRVHAYLNEAGGVRKSCARYRQDRRRGIPLGMNMFRRIKISSVAIKLLQITIASAPILLSIVYYQSYWQDKGGFPTSLGDKVFSIVFLTAGAYLTFGLLGAVFFALWGIIMAVFAILRGETSSMNHPKSTGQVYSQNDDVEDEWRHRFN